MFPLRISAGNVTESTVTEEILCIKLHFLYSEHKTIQFKKIILRRGFSKAEKVHSSSIVLFLKVFYK